MKQLLENEKVRKIIQIYIGIFCLTIGVACTIAFPILFLLSMGKLFETFWRGLASIIFLVPVIGFIAWTGLANGWKLLRIGQLFQWFQ